jgi:hypothetical protein
VRKGLVIAASWVAAVAAGAVLGVATISTVAGSTERSRPLSQREVSGRLSQTPQVSQGATTPSRSEPVQPPTATAGAARQYFTTSGGSLWASCADGRVTVETTTPRPGFRLDGSDRGPANEAWVRFKVDVEHGHATEYHVTVTCIAGVPQLTETVDS